MIEDDSPTLPGFKPAEDPPWFTAGKLTPVKFTKNVRAGRHPLGFALHPDESTSCGSCAHRFEHCRTRTYHKCGKNPNQSFSPGSDVRLRWRGCEHWEARPDGQEVERVHSR